MDVVKQIRNNFFGEDYKKYILTGFQEYFRKQIPMSDEEHEKCLKWLEEEFDVAGLVRLHLGVLNENGELHGYGVEMDNRGYMFKGEFKNGKHHGWFKHYLNKKFKGRGYAINGEIFFHFVVPEEDELGWFC